MALNPTQIAELTTEVATNPSAIPGLSWDLSNGDVLAEMNLVRAGKTVVRQTMSVQEIIEVLAENPSEVEALSSAKAQFLTILTQGDTVNPDNAGIVSSFQSIFGGASATLATLNAARQRDGSRAEELWKTNISLDDVRAARP